MVKMLHKKRYHSTNIGCLVKNSGMMPVHKVYYAEVQKELGYMHWYV